MLLERAVQARAQFFDSPHESAFRLFNGFLEGDPDVVIDLYAQTLVLHNYAQDPNSSAVKLQEAQAWLLQRFPWIRCVVLKTRAAAEMQDQRGRIVYGQNPDRQVREYGVWYALDLTLNIDASLYLDTRGLRRWAIDHLAGMKVLNTFAYTGSLGVAAYAGGAERVVQLDRNARFLQMAKQSYALNQFSVHSGDFLTGDFWPLVSQLKRRQELFDCVFIDPPFFSVTSGGRVDLVSQSMRVINKVRPLVGHQGFLVTINNALFVSGAEYKAMLDELCADGYLSIEELIPVPLDFTGTPQSRSGVLPVDPAPFNHSTKIAVLRVRRKDERA